MPYCIDYSIQDIVGELKAPLEIGISICQLTIKYDESNDTISVSD